jgi:hypothetical protein
VPNRSAVVRLFAVIAVAGSTFSVAWAQDEKKEDDTVVAFPPKDAKKDQPTAPDAKPATPPTTTPAGAKPAAAAQPDPKERARKIADLLDDWMHYTRVDKFDLAAANAQAILDAGLTDEEFTAIVDDNQTLANRFEDTVIRAQKHAEIEKLAASLQQKYDRGRRPTPATPRRSPATSSSSPARRTSASSPPSGSSTRASTRCRSSSRPCWTARTWSGRRRFVGSSSSSVATRSSRSARRS